MPRTLKENMFELYDQDHFDDVVIVAMMFGVVIYVCTSPARSSGRWMVPMSGSLSYSLSTIILGEPENDPFRRSQYKRDC